jgi:hypothetical protein
VLGLVLSLIVPPGSSPDEPSHLLRAYWLTKGVITLDTPVGMSSGQMVDDSLVGYVNTPSALSHHPGEAATADSAHPIMWSGRSHFIENPGVGYYFPLIYAPQAVGLALGEHLSLSVDHSYRLARFCALVFVLLTIALALRVHTPNPFTLALLALPICLFQDISTAQDGVAIATYLLALSLFVRGMDRSRSFPARMAVALCITVFAIVTCRNNLLPMVICPFAVAYVRRSKAGIAAALLVLIGSLAWTAIALKTTTDLRIVRSQPTSFFIHHYVAHPTDFLAILSHTLTHAGQLRFYAESFVGVLGRLDIALPTPFYQATGALLAVLAVLSLSARHLREDYATRLVLLLVAGGSGLLVFFAMATTWTPWGSPMIEGVQGRYFICSFLALGYALSGSSEGGRPRWRLAKLLLGAYAFASAYVIPSALIEHYYDDRAAVATGAPASAFTAQAIASGPLDHETISLHLAPDPHDIGHNGHIFVALQLPMGAIYLLHDGEWRPYDEARPLAFDVGPLAAKDVTLAIDQDLRRFADATLVVGYGQGDSPGDSLGELLAHSRYRRVAELH